VSAEPSEDAFEVEVGAIAHGGHCVARGPDGRVVFVRHALPGERVRVVVTEERASYLRADAVEVLAPAPGRVGPPCPYAGPDRCGGCDLQHASHEAQRELKAAVVVELLGRLGGLSLAEVEALGVRVAALPGGPLGWRTRVQYTVDADNRPGLLKHRSHEVVPVSRCLIAHPAVQASDATDRRWPDADAVEVAVSAAGERSVLTRDRAGRLKVAEGPAGLRERAVGREWTVPPDTFWQVHPAAAETLGAAVVELAQPRPGERAFDLYGGVGLFAAALAPHLGLSGRVDVVESDPRAVAAGRRAVRSLPQIHFIAAPVQRALRGPLRAAAVDIVVLDPPRAGAGRAVVTAIAGASPRAVVYVACDPAALARDVRMFRDLGWRLAQLHAYDLFPMTHHVECVAMLLNRVV
jgi:tRNA/tmRNA/rRNA uracil-C5-methylase (TrmA/RlmC/RlmD family)